MSTKESQINLRLPRELDRWLEEQAGGKRQKPSDRAWDGLGESEREGSKAERERWIGVYADRRER